LNVKIDAEIDYRELGSDLVIRKTVLLIFEEINDGEQGSNPIF
jgi:hypothetical protein